MLLLRVQEGLSAVTTLLPDYETCCSLLAITRAVRHRVSMKIHTYS